MTQENDNLPEPFIPITQQTEIEVIGDSIKIVPGDSNVVVKQRKE